MNGHRKFLGMLGAGVVAAAVNLKASRALAVTIPGTVLLRADRVIE